ncbi:unnamed protein product [Brachionus calyciflorus]|uniref:Uncharacterized protein n=1 Tax=Brachionus calyciflorus TaxID=104777 RepID=A0A813VB91_9BILA|nr:unnamed protein product [Brachionus calyciflorus]
MNYLSCQEFNGLTPDDCSKSACNTYCYTDEACITICGFDNSTKCFTANGSCFSSSEIKPIPTHKVCTKPTVTRKSRPTSTNQIDTTTETRPPNSSNFEKTNFFQLFWD